MKCLVPAERVARQAADSGLGKRMNILLRAADAAWPPDRGNRCT